MLQSTEDWATGRDFIHLLLLVENSMLPNGALGGAKKKKTFSSDAQINLVSPPHTPLQQKHYNNKAFVSTKKYPKVFCACKGDLLPIRH